MQNAEILTRYLRHIRGTADRGWSFLREHILLVIRAAELAPAEGHRMENVHTAGPLSERIPQYAAWGEVLAYVGTMIAREYPLRKRNKGNEEFRLNVRAYAHEVTIPGILSGNRPDNQGITIHRQVQIVQQGPLFDSRC